VRWRRVDIIGLGCLLWVVVMAVVAWVCYRVVR
jgi:hypothetical protein